MESLQHIVNTHVVNKDEKSLEALSEEIGYLIEFVKRRSARTMNEYERMRGNLDSAESNKRLVDNALEKVKEKS